MIRKAHKDALVGLHECCAGPTWYLMLEEDEIESRFSKLVFKILLVIYNLQNCSFAYLNVSVLHFRNLGTHFRVTY